MPNKGKTFYSLINSIDAVNEKMGWVVLFLLIALAAHICIEVFMRYILNSPTMASGDIWEIMQVVLAMIGAGYVLKEGGHVHIETLIDIMKPKTKDIINFITSILGAIYCGIMVWLSWLMLVASFDTKERFVSTLWLIYPVKIIFFIGFVLFLFGFISLSLKNVIKIMQEGKA